MYKSRRITAPSVLSVRPTTDAAKESLFNILANSFSFDEISFLDLFTGTGNISYEMASRGCQDIIAVDIDYRCTGFVKDTASNLGMEGLHVVKRDVYLYLQEVSRSYDIIFADPPYKHKETALIHELVFKRSLLKDDGCLILEHGDDQDFSSLPHFKDERRIGNVNFTIFKK